MSLVERSATSQTYSGAMLSFGIEVTAESSWLDPRSSLASAYLFLLADETALMEMLAESSFGPIGPAPGR